MDWLTFTAEIIEAVIWPLTVLIIFLMLREPISELVPLLQRMRYKDLELDFGRQVEEVAVEARNLLPPSLPVTQASRELRSHLMQLAELSPRAVILEAWIELEEAAIDASRRHGLNLTSREMRSPILLGEALEEAGLLDEGKLAIFHRLRNLRNAAAHAANFVFEPGSAIEYADAAIRLAEYLQEV